MNISNIHLSYSLRLSEPVLFPFSYKSKNSLIRNNWIVLSKPCVELPGGTDGKESACNSGKTWVPPLGWEDLLEEEMAIHSSILAWRIPWTEKPGELQSTRSQNVRPDWTWTHKVGVMEKRAVCIFNRIPRVTLC